VSGKREGRQGESHLESKQRRSGLLKRIGGGNWTEKKKVTGRKEAPGSATAVDSSLRECPPRNDKRPNIKGKNLKKMGHERARTVS